jgi:hypothetical protein
MTTTEQILQITEVITNLGKDILIAEESKKNALSEDLPIIEQKIQYLESILKEHKDRLQQLISK